MTCILNITSLNTSDSIVRRREGNFCEGFFYVYRKKLSHDNATVKKRSKKKQKKNENETKIHPDSRLITTYIIIINISYVGPVLDDYLPVGRDKNTPQSLMTTTTTRMRKRHRREFLFLYHFFFFFFPPFTT